MDSRGSGYIGCRDNNKWGRRVRMEGLGLGLQPYTHVVVMTHDWGIFKRWVGVN